MADPLSITTSIAGLVNLADVVFSRLYKYVKAVKSSSRDIQTLSCEIRALYGILSTLQLISIQLEGDVFDTTTRASHIQSCYQTLERVKSILERDDTSLLQDQRLETLKRKLRWPFTSPEVKDLVVEIERHKATLGLALSADGMSGLLRALSNQDDIKANMNDIKNDLRLRREAETRIEISKQRQEVLDSFGTIDPRQGYDMSRKLRHPGTSLWLIESPEYHLWLDQKSTRLWLYGIPGAGKSVLALVAIDEILQRSNPNNAVAYFYCDYKHPETQDPGGILGCLVQQIAKQDEQSFLKAQRFYETYGQGRKHPVEYDPQDLCRLIMEMASNYHCTMIVVDGLDECGSNAGQVTELLASLHTGIADAEIKLLLLSRDEFDIRESLEDCPAIAIAASSSDLRLYVDAELGNRTRKKKLNIKSSGLKEHIRDRLVEGADGMFRWVTCQIDYLCELPNDAARRNALENLPSGLYSTYERLLRRVNESNEEVKKLVQRTLRWIAHDKLDLSAKELCEAVSINLGDKSRNIEAIPDETEDFEQGGYASKKVSEDRFEKYPFRKHAVMSWTRHVRESDWNDAHLLTLATSLFHPSKPSTLISWAQDNFIHSYEPIHKDGLATFNTGLAEATTLHLAAVHNFPEICKWLIANGSDVNRNSTFGTPLHCALLPFSFRDYLSYSGGFRSHPHDVERTISLLLEAGAEPNTNYDGFSNMASASPLFIATVACEPETVQQLLRKGASVDDQLVNLLIEESGRYERSLLLPCILNHTSSALLSAKTRARAAQYALEHCMLEECSRTDTIGSKREKEASLRTAAAFGQVKVVISLLDDRGVDVDNVEEDTHMTALHHACANNQLDAAQILLMHSASPSKPDCKGRTALHHCIKGKGCHCLLYFLEQSMDFTVTDKENLTVWHLALLENNVEAFKILLSNTRSSPLLGKVKKTGGRSLLSCASRSGSIEPVSLLADAGCEFSEVESNGCTALHRAAEAGSPEVIRFLVAHRLDAKCLTADGSNAIHYAIMGNHARLDQVLDVLIDEGTDPFKARKDGMTPIGLLIGDGTDDASHSAREKALRKLVSLPESFQGKNEDLTQALHMLARFRSHEYSQWTATGLRLLLENGANLLSKDNEGRIAFRVLADTWREERSNEEEAIKVDVIGTVLKYIPFEGPLHDMCAEPGLLVTALEIEDDQLLDKLLDHNPNVDATIGDSDESPIELACRYCCRHTTLAKLLKRSKAMSDRAVGSELVRKACRFGSKYDREVLSTLLDAGLDPNGSSSQGKTALMFAARAGNADMVELLLSYGSNPKLKDPAGRSVAHYAISSGRVDVLYALKDTGVDWNAKANTNIEGWPRRGVTPLHLAATLEEDIALKYLLDENLIENTDAVTDRDETALYVASSFNNPHNVALLIHKMVDPASTARALNVAAKLGYEGVIMEFIHHGCDLTIRDSSGLDCEMVAWKHGQIQVAGIIEEHNQRHQNQAHDSTSKTRPVQAPEKRLQKLIAAIENKDMDLCKRTVRMGVDLDAGYKDCDGCTPLLYSLYQRKSTIAEYLASEGASPIGIPCSRFNSLGDSVFHIAAGLNYFELLRILLQRHPLQYQHLPDDIHPLHLAIIYGADECFDLIMDNAEMGESSALTPSFPKPESFAYHLANSRIRTLDFDEFYGFSPLDIAATVEETRIARRLLEAGSIVDGENKYYEAPLHLAASRGNVEMTKLLLEFGANPQLQDFNLRTPAILAAREGHLETIQALSEAGADLHIVDIYGANVLYYAALSGSIELVLQLMASMDWYDLGKETKLGFSCLTIAFLYGNDRLAALLNLAPSSGAYCPGESNVLTAAVRNPGMTIALFKMLLKRVPQELVPALLAHKDLVEETPLYAACTGCALPIQRDIMELLVRAGAELETEGGDHGTALMGACSAGRLGAVKILMQKGANMAYSKDGQTFSALRAAKYFPEIIQWLLVGRFMEGPKLLTYGEN